MTLVYAPQTTETTAIMTYFQNQNQARTQQALTIEPQLWQDMNSVPKSNLGIVPMPSDQFIYDYALAHPDTIQLGKEKRSISSIIHFFFLFFVALSNREKKNIPQRRCVHKVPRLDAL